MGQFLYISGDRTFIFMELFYDSLNQVHDVLYPHNNPKTIEEQEKSEANKKDVIENQYPVLRKIIGNIVSNAIRKKAHNLEYYEGEMFNIEDAIKDINELTKKQWKCSKKMEPLDYLVFQAKKI